MAWAAMRPAWGTARDRVDPTSPAAGRPASGNRMTCPDLHIPVITI